MVVVGRPPPPPHGRPPPTAHQTPPPQVLTDSWGGCRIKTSYSRPPPPHSNDPNLLQMVNKWCWDGFLIELPAHIPPNSEA